MATYYDIHGSSITFYEWAKLLVDDGYAQVAYTEIRGKLEDGETEADLAVSTRWLGINMGIYDGPLQIFETAVIAAPDARIRVDRYPNRESARTGHARVVWCIYSGLDSFAEVPPDAACITCQASPVRERFKAGSWLCLGCEVRVTAGDLLHPVPRLAV